MLKVLFLFVFLAATAAHSQSLFLSENGKYAYSQQDAVWNIQSAQPYLIFREELARPQMRYKLEKGRNEFKAKHWYSFDWYELQEMFAIDVPEYLRSQGASTFNEAKRRQFSRWEFDEKKFRHRKTVPAMREWGGLTHPPLRSLDLPLEQFDARFAPVDFDRISSPYFDPHLQSQIDKVSASELTFGNTVKLLMDRDSFRAKMALIRKARDHVYMSSLVFVCDKSTRKLVDLLIRKRREGVDVRVIADGFISKLLKHRECLQIMRKAGIEVLETRDFFKYKLKAIYHTKTLVVGDEAIAGGSNMLDADNTARGTDFQNRDADIYVKGPMVTDIARQFFENWQFHLKISGSGKAGTRLTSLQGELGAVRGKLVQERAQGRRGQEHYSKVLSSPDARMDGVCRFIKQAPYEDRHTVGKAYLLLLDRLQKHLVITDPVKSDTFVGKHDWLPLIDRFDNYDMFNLLHKKVQALARRGMPIDYITTNIDMAGNENVAIMNDRIRESLENGQELEANWSLLQLHASNKYYGGPHYKNLLKDWAPHKSVHVWTHMSFMHSKIFYFDRIAASIGSVNFQHNATDQAYESTSICMDASLNRQLDEALVLDMANSIPLVFSRLR